MKINVPYYSQYLNVIDPMWQKRACGVTCLKMLMGSRGRVTPTIDEMITEGNAIGAYGEHGWRHDGLVGLAEQYGARLSRAEWRKSDTKSPDEINEEGINFLVSELRAGRALIVSAIKKLS